MAGLNDSEEAALGTNPFSTGAGQTVSGIAGATVGGAAFVDDLYEDPVATMAAVKEQLKVITELHRWDDFVRAMAESFREQMRRANPYEEGTTDFQTFEDNYYAGMLLFEVALTVASGGLAQGAKQSATASKIATAASGTKVATAARVATRGYNALGAPSRFAQQKLIHATVEAGSLTLDGARALYKPARTFGKTFEIRKAISGVDLNKLDSLSPAAQRRAGKILSDSGLSDGDTIRLISRIDSLDDDARDRALEYLANGDGSRTRLLSEFDQETLEAFFPTRCSPTRVAGAGSPGGTFGSGGAASVLVSAQDGSLGCLQNPEQFREDLEAAFRQNGNVKSADAADVVRYVDSVDSDSKRARARMLVDEAGGNGGAEFLADADTDTRDAVLSFEVDTSDSDLPDDLDDHVRFSLAEEYSRGHFSLDGWADDIYDVDSEAAVAGEIADDIDALDDADNVEGLGRLLTKEASSESSGGGSYLAEVRQLSPGASDTPTKGAALELRVARAEAPDPDSGDTLRLDYEPDTDFTKIINHDDSEELLGRIAEVVYGSRDRINREEVTSHLRSDSEGKDAEFDAALESDENLNIYRESKNRKTVPKEDVDDQISRYLAHRILQGDTELSETRVTIYTRKKDQAQHLEDEYDNSIVSASAPPKTEE